MFGSSIISSVTHHLSNAGHYIVHSARSAGHAVVHNTADEISSSVNKAQGLWGRAEENGESAILHTTAEMKMAQYASLMNKLQKAFVEAISAHPEAVPHMKDAAMQRKVTPQLAGSVQQVTSHPAMHEALAEAAHQSFVSFGIEFGGAAEFIGGADLALGLAMGIPYVYQIGITGTVGVTAGAEAGGDADIALSLNMGAPKETGGPFVAILVEGDAEVGGGGAISFNLPDFSFGGISINAAVGEEVKVSGGVGYTAVLGN